MKVRLFLAAAAVLALGACSPQLPFTESFRTAIPAALLDANLGITAASADNSIDGFSVSLSVVPTVDRSSISADDLAAMIELIVENNNITNLESLQLLVVDGTDPELAFIDISTPAAELGLDDTDSDVENVEVDWDEVVAFVRDR